MCWCFIQVQSFAEHRLENRFFPFLQIHNLMRPNILHIYAGISRVDVLRRLYERLSKGMTCFSFTLICHVTESHHPIRLLICGFYCFHSSYEFIMSVHLNCEIPLNFNRFSHEIIWKTFIRCTHNEQQFHNRIKCKQLSNHKFEKVDTLLCLPVIAPKLSFIWRSQWNVKRAACAQILTRFFLHAPFALVFIWIFFFQSIYYFFCKSFCDGKNHRTGIFTFYCLNFNGTSRC